MPESILQKIKNEAKAFLIAPIYPFLQRDWILKMWIFGALAYVPIINLILARGWRMDYIHRLGWRYEKVLPSPRDLITFIKNGVSLWVSTGAFLLFPVVIIVFFGLGGWLDLWNDIVGLFELIIDYFLSRRLTTGEFFGALWNLLVNELIAEFLIFLIENIWLIVYVPIYRVGMIRFALTGNLFQSHLAVGRNLRFLFRNFIDIALMYAFNVFNFILILLIDSILTLTVIGVPLIPIVTFYMFFWNTGYEYGLLAQIMVEQENMTLEKDAKSYKR